MTLFAVLALPVPLAAQHTRYKLIDLGTFGGPHSYGSVNGDGFSLLNDPGVVASYADLAVPDPNASFFCYDPDCFQAHASKWKHGVITDLGALPGNNNSAAGSINARGWATGQSQTSTLDPVLGIPEFRAVLWKGGQTIDLGTLGDGTESLGIYVNDAGEIIGFSTINTEPDPLGFVFQTHTFIWKNGKKLDIGTLGGSDALPGASCSHTPEGMVWGGSTTTTTLNPDTGLPTADPFLWDHGKMTDLGTLGGTNGFAQCANHRRHVIGASSLAVNPAACNSGGSGCHAFFWEDGIMTDLGTLGGDNSEAIWLNQADMVVGSADLAGPSGSQTHDAVVWINGVIHDLGTVSGDACSRGRGLNARGQVVGGSSDCHNFLHAFVWEDGGPVVDLNTLIPAGSGLQLTNAFNINDRGEILAKAAPLGFTPDDDADLGHLVLLVPCGAREGDCSSSLQGANIAASAAFAPNTSSSATLPTSHRTDGEALVGWRKLRQDLKRVLK
jgi:probable HAF family extracellular repeat protein